MKYLTLIALALATSAQADFWDNCTAYGGTIITANSYGNDKGGYCNDPNNSNLANNCNGKRFCRAGNTMNFWSSFTWCEAIGGKLASFEHMCPETQSRPSNTQNGECPNLTTVGGGTWVHSSMGWNTNKMMTINLSNGRISSTSGTAACGRDTTTCAYPFCEEK